MTAAPIDLGLVVVSDPRASKDCPHCYGTGRRRCTGDEEGRCLDCRDVSDHACHLCFGRGKVPS